VHGDISPSTGQYDGLDASAHSPRMRSRSRRRSFVFCHAHVAGVCSAVFGISCCLYRRDVFDAVASMRACGLRICTRCLRKAEADDRRCVVISHAHMQHFVADAKRDLRMCQCDVVVSMSDHIQLDCGHCGRSGQLMIPS
jgi:hypothetical protein